MNEEKELKKDFEIPEIFRRVNKDVEKLFFPDRLESPPLTVYFTCDLHLGSFSTQYDLFLCRWSSAEADDPFSNEMSDREFGGMTEPRHQCHEDVLTMF